MEKQWIGLLDCNNFFVSCERLFRPDLRRRPVAVLSSNDGCIVARSQEIKDKGIPMGVPLFKVKDIIKDIEATTFSSNFTLYRDISRRVFEVMRTELGAIEQYSIDEAFFVIEGTEEKMLGTLRSIKDKVEQVVGVPVSLGVARSKTQAKYANSIAKKTTGTYVLSDAAWGDAQHSLPLSAIWGVGRGHTEQFQSHQLRTVFDLLSLDRSTVNRLFGVVGVRLWQELQGIQAFTVSSVVTDKQSITSSRSFKSTTIDFAVLEDALAYHVREVAKELRSLHLNAQYIGLFLGTNRFGDFFLQGGSAKETLTIPSNDTNALLSSAQGMLKTLYTSSVPYKKVGITVGGLLPESIAQLSIFDEKKESANNELMSVIDSINKRSGHDVLLVGTRLKAAQWQSSREALSPSYTTSWSDLAVVKA
jgi:DNA polymerase V